MALRDDVSDSFKQKGLKFVSLSESLKDPQKTTLVYIDAAGATVTKEINAPLDQVEETVSTLDAMDPDDIAAYLLE